MLLCRQIGFRLLLGELEVVHGLLLLKEAVGQLVAPLRLELRRHQLRHLPPPDCDSENELPVRAVKQRPDVESRMTVRSPAAGSHEPSHLTPTHTQNTPKTPTPPPSLFSPIAPRTLRS